MDESLLNGCGTVGPGTVNYLLEEMCSSIKAEVKLLAVFITTHLPFLKIFVISENGYA